MPQLVRYALEESRKLFPFRAASSQEDQRKHAKVLYKARLQNLFQQSEKLDTVWTSDTLFFAIPTSLGLLQPEDKLSPRLLLQFSLIETSEAAISSTNFQHSLICSSLAKYQDPKIKTLLTQRIKEYATQ
ncbi:hypothetical protein NE237_031961 [Protea cynaroides]|uniref:Uncharacterized protein n=1 Tax=Protea cynaroides TaxID=273540 RepID=A0A9Q0L2E6_9MAGN|nr:hypothetical protein NE237_031961 [Protea cynaroides]